jgi:hypothetical protein
MADQQLEMEQYPAGLLVGAFTTDRVIKFEHQQRRKIADYGS